MNCGKTDELIHGERLGALTPEEQIEFEAHLERCVRCRELVRPELYVDPVQPPEQLLSSILQATSGPACGRAGELLGQQLDGDLPPLDRRLVDAHSDECSACDKLRTAFSAVAQDLPAMRVLEPDARFATDLFARTSRSRTPRSAPSSLRLRRLWKRLVQRPRFAWEAAYVGAMLFWLLLGLPLIGMSGTPPDLRAYLSDFSGVRSVVQSLRDPVSDVGRRTWSSAQRDWSSKTLELQQDLQRRVDGLRTAVSTLDVEKSGQAVLAITEDACEVVQHLIYEDDNEPPQE